MEHNPEGPAIMDRPAASWFIARMLNVRTEMIRNGHEPHAVDDMLIGVCVRLLACIGTGFAGGGGEFRTRVIAALDEEFAKTSRKRRP